MAAAAREELGIAPLDPLDCHRYAGNAGLAVLSFEELTTLPAASRRQLLDVDPESWSGMTLKEGGVNAIILNPAHSVERQRNTLMHEIAHVLLKHVPTRVDFGPGGILLVSEFAEDDEGEADWLAGAMLLPREGLMACRSRGMTNTQIATYYGASGQLTDWRIRMTGIDVQRRRATTR